MGALLSFDFSCHSLLAYPASARLAEGESSFFLYRLPVCHIFLRSDEMRLTAGFYCGALHVFATKSYKSKAVTTYTIIHCFLFHIISWACLTSNKLQTYLTLIICKLFMDIRLTQNSIATNKCSFIQSCTWDFFFCIFFYIT